MEQSDVFKWSPRLHSLNESNRLIYETAVILNEANLVLHVWAPATTLWAARAPPGFDGWKLFIQYDNQFYVYASASAPTCSKSPPGAFDVQSAILPTSFTLWAAHHDPLLPALLSWPVSTPSTPRDFFRATTRCSTTLAATQWQPCTLPASVRDRCKPSGHASLRACVYTSLTFAPATRPQRRSKREYD